MSVTRIMFKTTITYTTEIIKFKLKVLIVEVDQIIKLLSNEKLKKKNIFYLLSMIVMLKNT